MKCREQEKSYLVQFMVYFLYQGYKLGVGGRKIKKKKIKGRIISFHANSYLKGRGQMIPFSYHSKALLVVYLPNMQGFLCSNMFFLSSDRDVLEIGLRARKCSHYFLYPLATLHTKIYCLVFGEGILPISYQLRITESQNIRSYIQRISIKYP